MWYNYRAANADQLRYSTDKTKSYLAGSEMFKATELEVFKITLIKNSKKLAAKPNKKSKETLLVTNQPKLSYGPKDYRTYE